MAAPSPAACSRAPSPAACSRAPSPAACSRAPSPAACSRGLQVRVSSLKFGNSLQDAQELLQFSQPNVQVTRPSSSTFPGLQSNSCRCRALLESSTAAPPASCFLATTCTATSSTAHSLSFQRRQGAACFESRDFTACMLCNKFPAASCHPPTRRVLFGSQLKATSSRSPKALGGLNRRKRRASSRRLPA